MFLQAVQSLKVALDVPRDVPLAPAVHFMTRIMRLPEKDDNGEPIPLPDLVNALVEKTGVVVEAESISAVVVEETPAVVPPAASGGEKKAISLKQSASPPIYPHSINTRAHSQFGALCAYFALRVDRLLLRQRSIKEGQQWFGHRCRSCPGAA